MFKYDRKVDSIKSLDSVNMYMSDNKDVCMSLSGNFEAKKTSQGMYIENGNVLLLNMFERVENGDKIYKILSYETNQTANNSSDYIESVNLENNSISYDLTDIKYTKSLCFKQKEGILQIKYLVENNSDAKMDMYIFPFVTCRDYINMKKENVLKFNQRKLDKGLMVNLSVTSNINLIFKSHDAKYIEEQQNICNIKHLCYFPDDTYIEALEDVFKPGEFKISLKKGESKEFSIYVATKDFDLNKILQEDLFEKEEKRKKEVLEGIEEEFVELRDLSLGLAICDLEDKLISNIPYFRDNSKIEIEKNEFRIDQIIDIIKDVTKVVKSIDGMYISLNKLKEAKVTLIKIRRFIKEVDLLKLEDLYALKEITLLKLWYIEIINRLFSKDGDVSVFVPQIKDIIIDTINNKNRELILEDLECVCLMYNALKIYENIVSTGIGEEIIAYNTYKKLENLLENEFWNGEKNVLKRNLRDVECIANISMIYTISLSYPCIIGNMKMKVLDTIFKELYTPYGLREVASNSENYNGNIYPMYMAHFLKANFRQNGVTRASQKLAYNLVKELLQDVSKYENCGIKKIYNDKNKDFISPTYDILTNAEMVRMYKMLI